MAQDFGDDVGEMLFRFMERNAENLMQEYAKTLVHQTVLGWYQARAERMGLSKEEAAYLAKAMANKEQACVGDYLTTNMVNIWSLHAACIPSPNGVSSVSRFIAEPDNLAFSALVAGNI